MRRFVVNWVVIVVAVYLAAKLLPGKISYQSTVDLLTFAVVLGLLDAFVLPVLKILSFPLNLISFGLFSLVLNAALFWAAAALEGHVTVAGFFSALIAAIIVSVVNLVVGHLL